MSRKLEPRPRRYNAVLIAGLLGVAAACGGDPTVGDVVVRVEVTPDRDTLTVGEIGIPFSATAFNARDDAVPSAEIRWSSDQPFVATVDSLTGAVEAVGTGGAAITARAAAVSDTAQVFVVGPLALPLDTILLFPGDTFTIPVEIRDGGGASPATFSGGIPGTATVDPTTGFVMAMGFGLANFTVHVDTFTQRGQIQVLDVPDTLFGNVYAELSGAQVGRMRFGSRGFNHPTLDNGTALNLNAVSFDGTRQLAILLVDSLVDPRMASIGELPESAIQPGADAVCRPPNDWSFYRHLDLDRRARSLSGTLSITTIQPVDGGRAVSGRFDITLQMFDTPGPAGVMRARGTFALPVVTLAMCPQGVSAPGPSLARGTLPVPPAGTPAAPRR